MTSISFLHYLNLYAISILSYKSSFLNKKKLKQYYPTKKLKQYYPLPLTPLFHVFILTINAFYFLLYKAILFAPAIITEYIMSRHANKIYNTLFSEILRVCFPNKIIDSYEITSRSNVWIQRATSELHPKKVNITAIFSICCSTNLHVKKIT